MPPHETNRYDNTNRGVLFRNRKKQAGDNRPDYTGRINVDGVDAFISGWIKESRAGDKFLSIAAQTEDQRKGGAGRRGNGQRPARPAAPAEPAQEQPADEDIPF